MSFSKPLILLTGATGFIGSHTWLTLLESGFSVIGIDNFSNSSAEVLNRLRQLSDQPVVFEELDVCNPSKLGHLVHKHSFAAAIHFAAFKAVGESTQKPLAYYRNNLDGLLTLCEALQSVACKTVVFSSSATVYGNPKSLPICENASLETTNPYGATKLISENILRDIQQADPQWRIALLRYFNPVGAHESGLIGEDPRGTPSNLMPYVSQVAVGVRPQLQVFGSDYATHDGTGVRDYIHVIDLALGHAAALRYLLNPQSTEALRKEVLTVNLGTGTGYSVLDVVQSFEKASGRSVPYTVVPRRPGDIDACYADSARAKDVLGWQAQRDLQQMCADTWRWQQMNPKGYESRQ